MSSGSNRLLMMWIAFLQSPVLLGILGWYIGPMRGASLSDAGTALSVAGALWTIAAGLIAQLLLPERIKRDGSESSFRTLCVLRWALAESIALLGVAGYIAGAPIEGLFLFTFASMAMTIWYSPFRRP